MTATLHGTPTLFPRRVLLDCPLAQMGCSTCCKSSHGCKCVWCDSDLHFIFLSWRVAYHATQTPVCCFFPPIVFISFHRLYGGNMRWVKQRFGIWFVWGIELFQFTKWLGLLSTDASQQQADCRPMTPDPSEAYDSWKHDALQMLLMALL